jgi:hypothetical protein
MNRRFISKVTVTGADDSIAAEDLIPIAKEYPFVEFGILLSMTAMGRPRFPSKSWLQSLVRVALANPLQLSGHLCGSWMRDSLVGSWPKLDFYMIDNQFQSVFSRWQINTHAQAQEISARDIPRIANGVALIRQNLIFQWDNVNNGLVGMAQGGGAQNIEVLFDLSHGAGRVPADWPCPLKWINCGYAGGLSPENVAEQIEKIEKVAEGRTVWIDAETQLRTPDNKIFDLARVRQFLEAARPWVMEGGK